MKKVILLAATTLIASAGFAGLGHMTEGELMSWATATGVTFSPTLAVAGISATITEALKNDIVQVQDDAVIALETGVISNELKSVVDKVRAEYQEDTMNASDIEVIDMVFGDI